MNTEPIKTFITMETSEEDLLKRCKALRINLTPIKENNMLTIKKVLKAILDLPRTSTGESDYGFVMRTKEDLSYLQGDILLEEVLDILKTESGITKEDFDEFINSYKEDLKGR